MCRYFSPSPLLFAQQAAAHAHFTVMYVAHCTVLGRCCSRTGLVEWVSAPFRWLVSCVHGGLLRGSALHLELLGWHEAYTFDLSEA